MKESKAQPPQQQHVLQAVDVDVHHEGVALSPTARRVQKLRHAMRQALQADSLTPREASRLAGKLAFLTQAVFGSVGRSAMQPLYARSHDTSTGADHRLSDGLRSAMKAIHHMLSNITPRFIPHVVDEQLHAVIFADDYVRVGEEVQKAGHIPTDLALPAHARDDNGWGYVVRIGNEVIFCHGTTPHSVLSKITSRRAFIYALEVFAQLMAILSLAQRLTANWLAFIDNTAGEAALRKGYGKDAFVNGMLAAFWDTAARRGWRPRFARVEAKANVADAVSRGDLSRALRENWVRMDDYTEAIIGILTRAAADADYAANQAVDDLSDAIN